MFAPVLPLRMILFQGLMLLVAIALEAIVLRRSLRIPYRISIEYAASINLLAMCIGWLLFFVVEPLLPIDLQQQLIGYVLFSQFFANTWADTVPIWIILSGIITFFVTFFVKLEGLELLLLLLDRRESRAPSLPQRRMSYRQRQASQGLQSPRQIRANAVLQANAISFTAILLLLLLRNTFQAM